MSQGNLKNHQKPIKAVKTLYMVKIALLDPKYTRFTAQKEKKMAKIADLALFIFIREICSFSWGISSSFKPEPFWLQNQCKWIAQLR